MSKVAQWWFRPFWDVEPRDLVEQGEPGCGKVGENLRLLHGFSVIFREALNGFCRSFHSGFKCFFKTKLVALADDKTAGCTLEFL